MKRHLVAILLLALSSCGGDGSGHLHSDYYVVSFEPGRSELPAAGHTVLSYATRDVDRGSPRAVTIKGYVPADRNLSELSEQRMKVVADALIEAGVARSIIRLTPQSIPAEDFARLGNAVVIRIERGEPTAPAPAPVEEE
jgi:hypothetical protein